MIRDSKAIRIGLFSGCLFTIPVVLPAAELAKPELAVWIDQRFAEQFGSVGLRMPEVVDDATFLRRVYLDLSGRIPTIAQVRDFTADVDPDKRFNVINILLRSERFNRHTARVWRRVLMPPNTTSNPNLTAAMDAWLQDQLDRRIGYDNLARRLVVAGGADPAIEDAIDDKAVESRAPSATDPEAMGRSPTAFLLQAGGQPASMASSVSRVFLGIRLECAQCHDHPFADWTQRDFWGVAAFFSGAKLIPQVNTRQVLEGAQIPELVDSRTTNVADQEGRSYTISLPWYDENATIEIPQDELPRQYFARWMTSADNPHFAATAVNRIWQHLCGKGLTDSVDDLDQANPQDRQPVLDGLAQAFARRGFNIRELMGAICASDYYQRTSEKSMSGGVAETRPLKVMTPEQLFDSLEVAASLPISSIDRGPRFNGEREALVRRMSEALSERPDEFRGGIPQALALMNGIITVNATDLKKSRALKAVISAPFLDFDEKIEALFLATLSRKPYEPERAQFRNYIDDRVSPQEKAEALSEVMWALMNSPEFVLIR